VQSSPLDDDVVVFQELRAVEAAADELATTDRETGPRTSTSTSVDGNA